MLDVRNLFRLCVTGFLSVPPRCTNEIILIILILILVGWNPGTRVPDFIMPSNAGSPSEFKGCFLNEDIGSLDDRPALG